ncbi:MAG: hypothetical protein AAF429_02020 [Pseudomonadota bacterium]
MAVIDFRHRPNLRGFSEALSADTHPKADIKSNAAHKTGRIRKSLRSLSHAALCIMIAVGSYQAYVIAKQVQFNLMVLVP